MGASSWGLTLVRMQSKPNEQAAAAREHDRTEAEHDSDEQTQAASVTEHSEEQQTAPWHQSEEQAATTVTEHSWTNRYMPVKSRGAQTATSEVFPSDPSGE